jgi:hypothetical protein
MRLPAPVAGLCGGELSGLYWFAVGSAILLTLAVILGDVDGEEEVRVAMIGNSIMYYNDLPRLLEAMSGGKLSQDSCLHGDASFESHLRYGNGMLEKWNTGQARMWDVDETEAAKEYYYEYSYYYNASEVDESKLYDYGACTVEQLLLGVDERLVEEVEHGRQYENDNNNNGDDATAAYDDAYAGSDDGIDDDTVVYDDDFYQDNYNEKYQLENDGTNPCLESANYYFYKQSQYDREGVPKWDYILLNDNSRSPCCTEQRATGLELLKDVYVPWFRETKATPIFMVTHAYWSSSRDMSGLTDIPTFLSLTYEGYREYAETVGQALPASQRPRLAPVGLAFLLIWEENPSMWRDLIHMDEIHLTPTGTYLEGLIVYATIYGHLPNPKIVLNGDIANLFSNARRMTPSTHIQEAYPTLDQARYLYHVAARIQAGELPRSFVRYEDGESADFVPDDESYQNQAYSGNNNNNHQ